MDSIVSAIYFISAAAWLAAVVMYWRQGQKGWAFFTAGLAALSLLLAVLKLPYFSA